ncbi:glycoside hydrolase family 13 protein [Devriesea agamarum]|uniref:glycoside hydrolase family 13 protein n=1 Tax=Devriesea agamarum TaxID=472569 RepID=UPI00071DD042|nr:glycoside hydrolase family 13 protein [Devriesea agamarum]
MSHEWWRDAVVYQVYPRSFADHNGDGMGDLPGITEKLPYLKELGVDAIWMSPFYTSPQNDAGYDVANYTDVDPRFGTLGDFDTLMERARELGIKVLVDIVPNHSSSEHPLFQEALAAQPGSAARDMYIFRDGTGESGELPPNNWQSIFHGDGWTRVTETDGSPGQWYLHLFDTTQPDWNWDNPRVHELFHDVLRFWLDRGVAGVRVDVAHGLVKAPGLPDAVSNQEGLIDTDENQTPPFFDQDGVHDIYREWRKIFDSYDGDRMMVGECWVPVERMALYVRPGEMHQIFNFSFLLARWDEEKIRSAIDTPLRDATAVGAPTTWVLSNHDVIRHASRYGFSPDRILGEGLGPDEDQPDRILGLRRARAMTVLMLSLPGSAYIYQGEELGLPEVPEIPDELREDPAHKRAGVPGRDGCRVPIPWEADAPAFGFSPTGASWLPQPEYFRQYAADSQTGVAGSTLEMYRQALRLRREYRLGSSDMTWCDDLAPGVLTLQVGQITVYLNTSEHTVPLPDGAQVLLTSADQEQPKRDHAPQLAPDTAIWVRG